MYSCIEQFFGVGPVICPNPGMQIWLILPENEDGAEPTQPSGGGEDEGERQHHQL